MDTPKPPELTSLDRCVRFALKNGLGGIGGVAAQIELEKLRYASATLAKLRERLKTMLRHPGFVGPSRTYGAGMTDGQVQLIRTLLAEFFPEKRDEG